MVFLGQICFFWERKVFFGTEIIFCLGCKSVFSGTKKGFFLGQKNDVFGTRKKKIFSGSEK